MTGDTNKLCSKEQIEEWASKRADDAGRLSRQLLDTMRYNERMRTAIANLEPIADRDWDGKWRIQKCLEALSNKDSDNG